MTDENFNKTYYDLDNVPFPAFVATVIDPTHADLYVKDSAGNHFLANVVKYTGTGNRKNKYEDLVPDDPTILNGTNGNMHITGG